MASRPVFVLWHSAAHRPGDSRVGLEQGGCILMFPAPPTPQYAILMTMVLTIFIKYVLHSVDLQSENPWDNKAVYMLYTELFTGEEPGPSQPVPVSPALPTKSCDLPLSVPLTPRLHQGPAVHGFHDHHDQGAYVPSLRHPADVPGHEVSLAGPATPSTPPRLPPLLKLSFQAVQESCD